MPDLPNVVLTPSPSAPSAVSPRRTKEEACYPSPRQIQRWRRCSLPIRVRRRIPRRREGNHLLLSCPLRQRTKRSHRIRFGPIRQSQPLEAPRRTLCGARVRLPSRRWPDVRVQLSALRVMRESRPTFLRPCPSEEERRLPDNPRRLETRLRRRRGSPEIPRLPQLRTRSRLQLRRRKAHMGWKRILQRRLSEICDADENRCSNQDQPHPSPSAPRTRQTR